jgi:hypothetical protein
VVLIEKSRQTVRYSETIHVPDLGLGWNTPLGTADAGTDISMLSSTDGDVVTVTERY